METPRPVLFHQACSSWLFVAFGNEFLTQKVEGAVCIPRQCHKGLSPKHAGCIRARLFLAGGNKVPNKGSSELED